MAKMKTEDLFPGDLPYYTRPRETIHRYMVRTKPKPRKLRDFKIKQLTKQQRLALQEFYNLAKDPEKKGLPLNELKREAAKTAGYSEGNQVRAMDRLLERKTVVDELENAGVTDARIAEVIADGLESEHPMKPGRPDPHAIIKYVQEANKLRDNYPDTKVKITKESRTMVVHFTAGNIEQFNKYQRMRQLNDPRNPDRT